MTIAKFISALLLGITTFGCSAMELDYDKLIMLDAENLSETGIGAAYSQLLPELKRCVPNPSRIEDVIDSNLPRYAIRVDGKEHVIYSPDSTEEESWGTATYVLFKIVNGQLGAASARFYAINGGNDPRGMFLTPDQAKAARSSLPNPSDWPYLPEPIGPWYGQHH